jgi:uncharacterized protein (UPF0276 family)
MSRDSWPSLGSGVGLRSKHYPVILKEWPAMDWFEAVTENYMDSGGRPVAVLDQVRRHYPVGLHGVALSIGSTDPLNELYLERMKRLVDYGVRLPSSFDKRPLKFGEFERCVRQAI